MMNNNNINIIYNVLNYYKKKNIINNNTYNYF